ncbi:26S proteasome non-ATPase regulatory subunit 8 [Histomonas meleagridis]|uniref:26S proteasome non-ATPase regulatory subunit 8 n=1 Tax=Histomonas meleagridis TaxID=135588 RepID=UPI00355A730E|nr:26S proteasome non-ATPase regulatory subunit 8 [Histomonas meleagridis]KAH0796493.1 26S proteasome non-ATPase regulatory subunit 8 [Histomonas meleagridis]
MGGRETVYRLLEQKCHSKMSEELYAKFEKLKNIFEGEFNQEEAGALIDELKIGLLQSNDDKVKIIHRSVLEYDALLSIQLCHVDDFERAMSQLNCYYFLSNFPFSEKMPLLISIHLVHYLAQQKLIDFNIELQIAQSIIHENEYIDYAKSLHQSIIDNSFSRLFALESNPPSQLFNHFTVELLSRVRNNHADSIERAYPSLKLTELMKMLEFPSLDECVKFVMKRNWKISDETTITFQPQNEGKTKSASEMLARSVDLSVQISSLA